MNEIRETIVRDKHSYHKKELGRCEAIYGKENLVLIDKTTKWGNPFTMDKDGGKDGNREDVIRKHREYLRKKPDLLRAIPRELSGKVLVCWCWPYECHGDILAYLANHPDKIEDFKQGKNPMKRKVQATLGSFE